jgi:hypothetical protein
MPDRRIDRAWMQRVATLWRADVRESATPQATETAMFFANEFAAELRPNNASSVWSTRRSASNRRSSRRRMGLLRAGLVA